jgi:hypothetical protein
MKRALKVLLLAVIVCVALWFFYGVLYFPDAPVHPCGTNQFCGKYGKIHSQEDYNAFLSWETGLFITFPIAFFCAIILYVIRKLKK